MVLPSREAIAEKYCEWLNSVTEATDPGLHVHEPKEFLESDGKTTWGYCNVAVVYTEGWYTTSVWRLDNGDEGGGTILTVYSREDGEIDTIVHEFDTMVDLIMQNGKLVNTEGFSH